MGEAKRDLQDFAAVQARLDEIVRAVSDDNVPLDTALDLYEEAVGLGMRASELLEDGIEVSDADDGADQVQDVSEVASEDAVAPVEELSE